MMVHLSPCTKLSHILQNIHTYRSFIWTNDEDYHHDTRKLIISVVVGVEKEGVNRLQTIGLLDLLEFMCIIEKFIHPKKRRERESRRSR